MFFPVYIWYGQCIFRHLGYCDVTFLHPPKFLLKSVTHILIQSSLGGQTSARHNEAITLHALALASQDCFNFYFLIHTLGIALPSSQPAGKTKLDIVYGILPNTGKQNMFNEYQLLWYRLALPWSACLTILLKSCSIINSWKGETIIKFYFGMELQRQLKSKLFL